MKADRHILQSTGRLYRLIRKDLVHPKHDGNFVPSYREPLEPLGGVERPSFDGKLPILLGARCITPAASDRLVVYTDGSIVGKQNGKSVGGLGIYFTNSEGKYKNRMEIFDGPQTVWAAELNAILRVLQICRNEEREIEVRSDALIPINSICLHDEANRNLDPANRRLIENPQYQSLVSLVQSEYQNTKATLYLRFIKAHIGEHGNYMADRLAKQAKRLLGASSRNQSFSMERVSEPLIPQQSHRFSCIA